MSIETTLTDQQFEYVANLKTAYLQTMIGYYSYNLSGMHYFYLKLTAKLLFSPFLQKDCMEKLNGQDAVQAVISLHRAALLFNAFPCFRDEQWKPYPPNSRSQKLFFFRSGAIWSQEAGGGREFFTIGKDTLPLQPGATTAPVTGLNCAIASPGGNR